MHTYINRCDGLSFTIKWQQKSIAVDQWMQKLLAKNVTSKWIKAKFIDFRQSDVMCLCFFLEHSGFTMLFASTVERRASATLCSVVQSRPTLCHPKDCSPPGSSVHGILQARILGWVVMPSSRGSSRPRDRTQVTRTGGRFFTIWATREAQEYWRE